MGIVGVIELNDGQNVNIPDILYGNADIIGLSEYYFYYSNGQSPATSINMNKYKNEVDAKGAVGTRTQLYNMTQYLRDLRPTSEYESGTAHNYMAAIESHASWIFGSIEEGGTFLIKTDNGKYHIMVLQGTYYRADAENQIATWFANAPSNNAAGFSATELSTIYFVSYGEISGDPNLTCFYTPDNYSYAYFLPTGILGSQLFINVSITDAMNDATWDNVLPAVSLNGVAPHKMFKGYYNNALTSNCFTQIGNDSSSVYANYIKSGGSIWGGSKLDPSTNPYGSTATTGGGNGPWDTSTDQVSPTDDDQFDTDAINSGFFTLYNPTKAAVKAFNNYLFTDITDAMSSVLKRLIADPIDYVVFCAMCHFTPNTSGTGNIAFCGLDTGIAANVINKQMQKISCGGVDLFSWVNGEKKDDTASFLSYNPYYQIYIYLPYIGIQQLNPDWVQYGTLYVDYWVDLLTGSCIAQLSVERDSRIYLDAPILHSVIAEYTGNCYENLPMSATDWRGLVSSVMQFAGGAISTASGNASGFGAMASAVLAEKVRPSQSGQLASNYGYMGKQKPYLFLARPILQTPKDFEQWEGFPSNILQKLGKMHGYTELDSSTLWVNSFDGITEDEAEMLRNICEQGFYL